MNRGQLIHGLRQLKVQTGSLACMGCRREDNCGIKGCAILRQAAKALEQLPAPEPLTPAQVKAMDYDKVWIDYGEDGEWGIIVDGLLYSISTLEGAGFVDMLQDAVVRGEDVERPSGSYRLYRTQRIYEEENHAETD